MNQGDLPVTETVILSLAQCRRPARAGDRASIMSDEGPVMGLERRDVGRWMSKDEQQHILLLPSAFGLFRRETRLDIDGVESAGLDACSG